MSVSFHAAAAKLFVRGPWPTKGITPVFTLTGQHSTRGIDCGGFYPSRIEMFLRAVGWRIMSTPTALIRTQRMSET